MNKKEQNITTAFDQELDDNYELPHGWKYSRLLKLFEREIYFSKMADWCEAAVKSEKLPDSLIKIILENDNE